MNLALHPSGSGIPGLDDTPRKPSKVLVIGIAVSAAAHLGLIGYLAYTKYVTPLPMAQEDPGFRLELPYAGSDAAPRARSAAGQAAGHPTRPRRRWSARAADGPGRADATARAPAQGDHPGQLAAHALGGRSLALLSGKRPAARPVRFGDAELHGRPQRRGPKRPPTKASAMRR